VAELDLAIGISKKKRLLFKILMGILGSMFFLPERSVGKKKKKKKKMDRMQLLQEKARGSAPGEPPEGYDVQ
jgi:hypothetical protein